MKIGFFGVDGWEEKTIKEAFPNDELYISKEKIDEIDLPDQKDFDVLSVFINSRLTGDVLENFPNLKFVAARSTGFDHVDLDICKKRDIKVSYVPGYGDNTVAEFTFGLILSLTRKIYDSIDRIKETGNFDFHDLRGIDIKSKTLGVVGTGRIGRESIKIAKGFSMNVVAYDPYPDKKAAKELGFKYVPFEDLLKQSDIITLHCPYTPETHHLINKESINLIKKGTFLINTARGQIVETEALIEALDRKILAGAGLDVLEEEGEIKDELHFLTAGHPKGEDIKIMLYDHMLMRMPNVMVTPHNSFNSQEALMRILDTTIENIKNFKNDNLDEVNLVPEKS